VLDVLCVLALQALCASVEADTRRLALLAGVGRETARTALLRLSSDGWITQARAAEGPHGARWAIRPTDRVSTDPVVGRSQADPRPVGAGAAERSTLLATLTTRLRDAAHDLFTLGALGHHAGNVYARTGAAPHDVETIARAGGSTIDQASRVLDRLSLAGVVVQERSGWRRHKADHRSSRCRSPGRRRPPDGSSPPLPCRARAVGMVAGRGDMDACTTAHTSEPTTRPGTARAPARNRDERLWRPPARRPSTGSQASYPDRPLARMCGRRRNPLLSFAGPNGMSAPGATRRGVERLNSSAPPQDPWSHHRDEFRGRSRAAMLVLAARA
jgi:hypothetical protein